MARFMACLSPYETFTFRSPSRRTAGFAMPRDAQSSQPPLSLDTRSSRGYASNAKRHFEKRSPSMQQRSRERWMTTIPTSKRHRWNCGVHGGNGSENGKTRPGLLGQPQPAVGIRAARLATRDRRVGRRLQPGFGVALAHRRSALEIRGAGPTRTHGCRAFGWSRRHGQARCRSVPPGHNAGSNQAWQTDRHTLLRYPHRDRSRAESRAGSRLIHS